MLIYVQNHLTVEKVITTRPQRWPYV